MSIQAVAWALEQDLPARPKLVLVSIANHANHVDGYCWLKAETIARESACTPRSVYNFVGALVRNGYIRKATRKSDDGKQRANDYWILFDREEKEWDSAATLDVDESDSEPPENASAETDPPDIVDRVNAVPTEETAEPGEHHDTRQPVEIPAGSPGPSEAAFTRKRIAEPSNTKPEASSACARVHRSTLRAYRPPPSQPVAADTEAKTNPIFVFEGTPAYQAWAIVKTREQGLSFRANGDPSWHLITRKLVDGRWRSGWWFPTLFPPQAQPPPESESSTKGTLCTDDDMKQQL